MPFRVSSANCSSTIYPDVDTNYAFRFVHDSRHVWLDADFSLAGEMVVAERMLTRLSHSGCFSDSLAYRLLEAETLGQALFANVYGRFPTDQMRFAQYCAEVGVDEGIELEWAHEQAERVGA